MRYSWKSSRTPGSGPKSCRSRGFSIHQLMERPESPLSEGAVPSSDPLALLRPATLLRNPLPEPWRTLSVLALLLCGFWMLYFHIGLAMEARGTLHNNVFFHS